MKKSDFPAMRLMHLSWKQRLKDFLNGKEIATIVHFSHEECELGAWIYSDGMSKYGKMPEMQELEKIHKEMHLVAQRIIKMNRSGSVPDLEQEITKIENLSQKLYSLLITMEDRFK